MKIFERWQTWGAIGVLAIAVATAEACKSAGGCKVKVSLPGPVELTVDGHWSYRDSDGRCFAVRFYDGNGNEVGAGSVTNGSGSGTVPSNATRWEAEQVPCPEQIAGSFLADVVVVGGPIGFERGDRAHNALYELVVLCDPSSGEAGRVAREVIEAPLGAPIPSNVTVVFLAEAFQDLASGRIVSLSQAPLVDFRIDLNDEIGYADLATGTNAVQTQIAPGVWSVTSVVAFGDVKGCDRWNAIGIEQRGANQTGRTVVAEKVILYN